MPHVMDSHPPLLGIDSVYDPIVAGAYTVQLLRSGQLARLARKRIVSQCLNAFEDASQNVYENVPRPSRPQALAMVSSGEAILALLFRVEGILPSNRGQSLPPRRRGMPAT